MHHCPACGSAGVSLPFGFKRCPNDGLVYNPQAKVIPYDENYFDWEYRNQYGRSYLEDKENIQQRMRQRLQQFLRLREPVSFGESLLEIGSASGFFLELAAQAGFSVEGWEISAAAAQTANQGGWFTRTGDFFSLYDDWLRRQAPPFHVIAAFYTVEHFADQASFWSAARRLVNDRGWLLLTLPSTAGPLFHFHYKKWAQTHPIDHFVDYSPGSLKKIAASYGFTLIQASSEGIHPTRFPGGCWPGLKQLWAGLQRWLPFSDTFYGILRKQI